MQFSLGPLSGHAVIPMKSIIACEIKVFLEEGYWLIFDICIITFSDIVKVTLDKQFLEHDA